MDDTLPIKPFEIEILHDIASSSDDSALRVALRILTVGSDSPSEMQAAARGRAQKQCQAELARWRSAPIVGPSLTCDHLSDLLVFASRADDRHARRVINQVIVHRATTMMSVGPDNVNCPEDAICLAAWNARAARLAGAAP